MLAEADRVRDLQQQLMQAAQHKVADRKAVVRAFSAYLPTASAP
jgi:hypothetical protein